MLKKRTVPCPLFLRSCLIELFVHTTTTLTVSKSFAPLALTGAAHVLMLEVQMTVARAVHGSLDDGLPMSTNNTTTCPILDDNALHVGLALVLGPTSRVKVPDLPK